MKKNERERKRLEEKEWREREGIITAERKRISKRNAKKEKNCER